MPHTAVTYTIESPALLHLTLAVMDQGDGAAKYTIAVQWVY